MKHEKYNVLWLTAGRESEEPQREDGCEDDRENTDELRKRLWPDKRPTAMQPALYISEQEKSSNSTRK